MKTKSIILATLLVLGISFEPLAQQPLRSSRPSTTAQHPGGRGPQRVPPTTESAFKPDLVVTGIIYEQASTIRVRVMNQGNGDAGACYLALMIMKSDSPNGGSLKVWTIPVPALKAHKGYSNTINIAPYTYADHAFLARIDRSDQVKESDESNNDLFNDEHVIH